MRRFLLFLVVVSSFGWGYLLLAQNIEIADAVTEDDVYHLKASASIDEFVKSVNEFYDIDEGNRLSSSEFLNALRFHCREVFPLSDADLDVLSAIIDTGKVHPGTEVRYYPRIRFDEATEFINSDIIKVTFGMQGLLVDGVRFKPDDDQAKRIFSLYVRFLFK